MMLYTDCPYPILVGIPILLFIALMGYVSLIFSEQSNQETIRWRLLELGLAIFTLVLLSVILVEKNVSKLAYQGASWIDTNALRYADIQDRSYPIHVVPLGLLTFGLIVFVGMRLVYLQRFRKPTLSPFSIKEGFDNLPSGGCFADQNGEIVLCNLQMHRLCQSLMGSDLQHLSDLDAALEHPNPLVTRVDAVAKIYQFPDQTLWRFDEKQITDEHEVSYQQVQAFDVTDLYQVEQALKNENQELSAANARARTLFRELDELVHEEERLAAQIQLHDALGRQLLYSRKCLNEEAPLTILRKNGEDWMNAIHLIQHGETEKPDRGEHPQSDMYANLQELIDSANEIGIEIEQTGTLPQDEKSAYLVLVAIRECTTNAVRHAQGTKMYVNMKMVENAFEISITNNGKVPTSPIQEGGGLSALRRRVERAGGTMVIQSIPKFELRIRLPKRNGEEEYL